MSPSLQRTPKLAKNHFTPSRGAVSMLRVYGRRWRRDSAAFHQICSPGQAAKVVVLVLVRSVCVCVDRAVCESVRQRIQRFSAPIMGACHRGAVPSLRCPVVYVAKQVAPQTAMAAAMATRTPRTPPLLVSTVARPRLQPCRCATKCLRGQHQHQQHQAEKQSHRFLSLRGRPSQLHCCCLLYTSPSPRDRG